MIYFLYFIYAINIISFLYPAIFKSEDTLNNATFASGIVTILMSIMFAVNKLEG